MRFIPLQNEMSYQLGYHSNEDPEIYTIDYSPSKL